MRLSKDEAPSKVNLHFYMHIASLRWATRMIPKFTALASMTTIFFTGASMVELRVSIATAARTSSTHSACTCFGGGGAKNGNE